MSGSHVQPTMCSLENRRKTQNSSSSCFFYCWLTSTKKTQLSSNRLSCDRLVLPGTITMYFWWRMCSVVPYWWSCNWFLSLFFAVTPVTSHAGSYDMFRHHKEIQWLVRSTWADGSDRWSDRWWCRKQWNSDVSWILSDVTNEWTLTSRDKIR